MEWIVIIASILVGGKVFMNYSDRQVEGVEREEERLKEITEEKKTKGSGFLDGFDIGPMFEYFCDVRHSGFRRFDREGRNCYGDIGSEYIYIYHHGDIVFRVTYYKTHRATHEGVEILVSPHSFDELYRHQDGFSISGGILDKTKGFIVWKNKEWKERGPWEETIKKYLCELRRSWNGDKAKIQIDDMEWEAKLDNMRWDEQRKHEDLILDTRDSWVDKRSGPLSKESIEQKAREVK